ncbi:flavin reductase family protein [Methylococcus sp. EFPC2]|uniref:flavin reductase family protein n=1 Tax=Methylococcus sp. EFPC2 TaxID=2812648 RepID=UPI001967D3FB|nr:flavin reductase family protein [Methylococcus sp. EFPC2]QSA96477.1 flavin reductase [Methylococcus sp. EFPC2]
MLASLFETLTHGVYVIGVTDGTRHNAFTAAWLMQASFDPPLLALSINPRHSSYRLLQAGRVFTVNVLPAGRTDLARHFGQPASVDKLASVSWTADARGAPLLPEALAWFSCELSGEYPAGDHVLALGLVRDGKRLESERSPMNYRETADMDGASALLPASLVQS